MNNNRNYFTEIEALETILEFLENDYDGYYEDLHNEIFNSDYYILGTYQAKQALNEYDVFASIEKVMRYEKDNFGEVSTEIHDPEKLANILWYIIGEEVLNNLDLNEEGFGGTGETDEEQEIKYQENIDKIKAAIVKLQGGAN